MKKIKCLVILLLIFIITVVLINFYGRSMMFLFGWFYGMLGALAIMYGLLKLWPVFNPEFKNMDSNMVELFKTILPSMLFDTRSNSVITKESYSILIIGFISLTLGVILMFI